MYGLEFWHKLSEKYKKAGKNVCKLIDFAKDLVR